MMVIEFDKLSLAANADRLPIDQTHQRYWQAHVKRYIALTQRDDCQSRLRQRLNSRPQLECRYKGVRDKHAVASSAALPKPIQRRSIESMIMGDVTPGPQHHLGST